MALTSALFVLLYMVCFLHTHWGNTSLAHRNYGALADPLQSLAQPESGRAHHFDLANSSRSQSTTDQETGEAGFASPASAKLGYFADSRFKT